MTDTPHAAADPADPIAAVAHPDPYPYYARLVRHRPLGRDAADGPWIAAGASVVAGLLAHPACRVRPPGEPVPAALAGTTAGALFARLVRQRDDAARLPARHALADWSAAITDAAIADAADRALAALPDHGDVAIAAEAAMWRVPVAAVGRLLGAAAPDALAPDVAALVRAFARGGDAPVARLDDALGTAGDPDARANAVGLLVQAHDATAGLIGNACVALARDAALRRAVGADPARLPALLREVARHDAPVQCTRRWLAADAVVAGHRLRAGDAVLLLLAAANRDPAANAAPHVLDPDRAAPRCFTFGLGAHACLGARLAVGIAARAVARLLARAGDGLAALAAPVGYHPSVNARLPRFAPPS